MILMPQGNNNLIRVYFNDYLYTTIKNKAERLGVTMSMLIRSYVIYCIDNDKKVYLFNSEESK